MRGPARRVGGLLIAAVLGVLALTVPCGPSRAQGCILDNCVDQKPLAGQGPSMRTPQAAPYDRRAGPRGPSVPGDFDFYVLSLSWSPGFCSTGGGAKARSQCESGADLGFVVHGLWPQYEHGFPSDCGGAARSPSRIALQATQGLYPDEGLARYEWRKHGTCSGKSPTDYFADVKRARGAITIPPPFRTAKEAQNWTPVDIERAFIAANPRLRPGMMAVECRRGVLEEVRFCMSKDARDFRACPEVSRQTCRTRQLSVPPML